MLRQVHAEMMQAISEGVALVVSALARDMDAEKLTTHLRAQVLAAKAQNVNPLAIRLATESLAAAEAETVLQRKATH